MAGAVPRAQGGSAVSQDDPPVVSMAPGSHDARSPDLDPGPPTDRPRPRRWRHAGDGPRRRPARPPEPRHPLRCGGRDLHRLPDRRDGRGGDAPRPARGRGPPPEEGGLLPAQRAQAAPPRATRRVDVPGPALPQEPGASAPGRNGLGHLAPLLVQRGLPRDWRQRLLGDPRLRRRLARRRRLLLLRPARGLRAPGARRAPLRRRGHRRPDPAALRARARGRADHRGRSDRQGHLQGTQLPRARDLDPLPVLRDRAGGRRRAHAPHARRRAGRPDPAQGRPPAPLRLRRGARCDRGGRAGGAAGPALPSRHA